MNREEKMNYLELYRNTLMFIDKKIPLLEHSDKDVKKTANQLNAIQKKLTGISFLAAWVVFSIITLVPMSLLNIVIETELNFFYLTPLISFIILFLYKTRTDTNRKNQISAMKDALVRQQKDNKNLIGEINYSINLANELLQNLLITEEKNDIVNCDIVFTNITALNYAYVYIGETAGASFVSAIKHYKDIIADIRSKNISPELIEEYEKDNLKAQYRKGAILRCLKVEKE